MIQSGHGLVEHPGLQALGRALHVQPGHRPAGMEYIVFV